jgi:hypothetical protein
LIGDLFIEYWGLVAAFIGCLDAVASFGFVDMLFGLDEAVIDFVVWMIGFVFESAVRVGIGLVGDFEIKLSSFEV